MQAIPATHRRWRLGRRPGLDGLRGVAVLLVIVSHVWDMHYANLGPVGVTLFFTLSGFLITNLLLEEHERTGAVSLGRFYGRRARRLLPAAVVTIAVVGGVERGLGFGSLGKLLAILAYAANWYQMSGHWMGLLGHTWSLAVEEQFYLVWPLVLLGLVRAPAPRRTVAVVATAGAVLSVAESAVLWAAGAGADRIYFGSDTRAAALLVGCALAAVLQGSPGWATGRWGPGRWLTGRWAPVLAVTLVAGLVLVGVPSGSFRHAVLTPTVTTLVAPVVVLLLVVGDHVGLFGNRVLRYVGRRSYGLYLWHVPLIYGVQLWAGRALVPRLTAVAVAVAVAELSWRWIEQPWLRRARVGVDPHPSMEVSAGSPSTSTTAGAQKQTMSLTSTASFSGSG